MKTNKEKLWILLIQDRHHWEFSYYLTIQINVDQLP